MPILVSSTWSSAQPNDRNALVKKVARVYGVQDDEDGKALALDCLDDVIKEMNTRTWEFNIIEQTALVMTSGQEYVQLAAGFYKEKLAYLVKTSDSSSSTPLQFVDWPTFRRLYSPDPDVPTDRPIAYSVQNIEGEGRVYLGPSPSSSTATDYTLTVEYYRRIPLLSETEQLVVPQEIENALLYGAQKRMAYHIAGPDAPDVGTFHGLEDVAITRLMEIDRKRPDGGMRFRIVDNMRGRRGGGPVDGSIYIRVR